MHARGTPNQRCNAKLQGEMEHEATRQMLRTTTLNTNVPEQVPVTGDRHLCKSHARPLLRTYIRNLLSGILSTEKILNHCRAVTFSIVTHRTHRAADCSNTGSDDERRFDGMGGGIRVENHHPVCTYVRTHVRAGVRNPKHIMD